MPETLLVEFQAAQQGWIRWHTTAPSLDVQRNYGRRWRWTALWERIWHQWITENQVLGTLDQFVEKTIVFWQPLYPLLDADVLYDLTIEIEWERWLLANSTLKDWPQFVAASWEQMTVLVSEPPNSSLQEVVPSVLPEPSEDHTVQDNEPDQASPNTTVHESPKSSTNQQPRLRIVANTPEDDALLFAWQQAMQQAGVSKSYSRQRRCEVARALQAAGCTLRDLIADDPQWSIVTRHAIKDFQQWQDSHS